MAFDGGMLYKVKNELLTAVDCHVDKIYQPSRDELIISFRKKGFVKRVFISARPGASRIHFTENKFENPETPPMFCMLLRKHLSSARLVAVEQNGFERVLELVFFAADEMGDLVTLRLVCELIGNQSNIILVGNEGRIIDSVRRSDIESGKRLVQPGARYEYPASQQKLDPTRENIANICAELFSFDDIPLSKALLRTVNGFSPLICREIACLVSENDVSVSECDKNNVTNAVSLVVGALSGQGTPVMLTEENGTPFDYSYVDICQYGNKFTKKQFGTYSELLDGFYTARDTAARISHSAKDIIRLVENLKTRAEKRLALRLDELKNCQNREEYRIFGELLKANLYAIQQGSRFAEVPNYYDESLNTVRIPLDPSLSPAANAAKYFKDYKKTYTAEQHLNTLTQNDKSEIEYFDSVLDSISRCTALSDINEIREELADAGYLRSTAKKQKKNNKGTALLEYTSSEGYRIVVGKNNRQNDYITTVLAAKNDLWFHVKNIPGSHVVVMCNGGEVSDETVSAAAQLAAYHSKASSSSNVPVDYTPVKYVKKPNGSKPGMVIYTTNKTVYVTPKEINL